MDEEGRARFFSSAAIQLASDKARADAATEPSALQVALAQQVSELRDRVRELEGQVAELLAKE